MIEPVDFEAKRAALEASLKDQEDALAGPRAEQELADLAAFIAARAQYGVSNVARIFVDYTPGLPTFVLAHTPDRNTVKRYRDTVRPAEGKIVDGSAAAEAVVAMTLVYPEPDVFTKLCEARPGLKAQLGMQALKLAAGSEVASGKG